MHLKRLHARGFKRFHDLTIEIDTTPRLVVMAGPNGMGKSSVIDAVRLWHGGHGSGEGWFLDETYHRKTGETFKGVDELVKIEFHEPTEGVDARMLVYARSAYRHEPDFTSNGVSQGADLYQRPSQRMIEAEQQVGRNYQRLVAQTLNDIYSQVDDTETVAAVRERNIGRAREAMSKLFPDLTLQGPGNPLQGGTFFFMKAQQPQFHYKNLSAGEKAAFDLILDVIVKSAVFTDTVVLIDEPEIHLNSRVQSTLLDVLLDLLPANGQLWVATHAIGMMKRAQELFESDPTSVAFLDFSGHNFDAPTVMTPVRPDRAFWNRALEVALGDLASLVAPDQVVMCEGRAPNNALNPARAEFDARCYRAIFSARYPRTDFLSVGNSLDVASDRLELGKAIQTLVTGTLVRRVIDRDGRTDAEVRDLQASGTRVLRRRHLEAYLLDREVLVELCRSVDQADQIDQVAQLLHEALQDSVGEGNAPDDVKRAAGRFFVKVRQHLGLTDAGHSTEAFLADTMAPLLSPDMTVYRELEEDVFGDD